MTTRICLFLLTTMLSFSSIAMTAAAVGNSYTLTIQQLALAPNAGGQDAYSLRLSKNDNIEYTIFANEYLRTGKYPLTGVLYSWRYSVCGRLCPVRAFAQIGVGGSSAGPMMELLVNITPLWLFRLDFATHLYTIPNRVIVWSYPFWLGISVPF